MFTISQDNGTICLTRGDVCSFPVSIKYLNGLPYTFLKGDVLRFTVMNVKDYSDILIQKDFPAEAEAQYVMVHLDKDETKIGKVTNKPVDYHYEIEINPDTDPQTIIGHDNTGGKIFRLYPEGSAKT